MKDLDQDNLQDLVSTHDTVLVQYGAGWCGNCRMVKPKVKALASETPDIAFVYVDAEKFPNSRSLANVSALPTFAAFKNGQLVGQNQGTKIDSVKELVDALASH